MRNQEIFQATIGRDAGKRFVITEMAATKAERWALRALIAMSHAGVDITPDQQKLGMAGIAMAGLKSLHSLDFDEARPLLDEMWTCVQIMPDPQRPEVVRKLMMNEMEGDDIEEVATIWQIRERIFRLHTDFFMKGKPSRTS